MRLVEHLSSCGLGGKKVVFSNKKGDHKHIRETLETHYPKLSIQNGAFQLLKCQSGGSGVRNLVPMTIPPGGYTVTELKEQCKSSLFYIKPLQKDIELIFQQEELLEPSSPSCSVCVVCERCGTSVELNKFEQHYVSCKDDHDDDVYLPPALKEKENAKSEAFHADQNNISSKELFDHLKGMELNFKEEELRAVAETAVDVNDALDKLLCHNPNLLFYFELLHLYLVLLFKLLLLDLALPK